MPNNYEKLFSTLDAPNPPAGLTERILSRITMREKRILGIRIALSAVVFSASTTIVVMGSMDLVSSLARSGFFSIASLAFSDFSSIAANFPDFVYSIAESFPIFTTAILLGGIMFAVWSMAALIDGTSLMHTRNKFLLLK